MPVSVDCVVFASGSGERCVTPSHQTLKIPPTPSIHFTSRVSIRSIIIKYCTLYSYYSILPYSMLPLSLGNPGTISDTPAQPDRFSQDLPNSASHTLARLAAKTNPFQKAIIRLARMGTPERAELRF